MLIKSYPVLIKHDIFPKKISGDSFLKCLKPKLSYTFTMFPEFKVQHRNAS